MIPFAGCKSKPQPRANRNDRYILRRSGRAELAAHIRPLRALKSSRYIQSHFVHSASRDPRFPPRIPLAKYFANIALATILLCLPSGLDFIWILLPPLRHPARGYAK